MGETTIEENKEFKMHKEDIREMALVTVQEAMKRGLSVYEIEKLAAHITCLAKFQTLENKEVKTEKTPLVWDFN